MPKVSKACATPFERKPYTNGLEGSGGSRVSSGSAVSSMRSDADRPPKYLFHCMLAYTDDPRIERSLSVPSTMTLEDMHKVMQIAFGWTNSHAWHFQLYKIDNSEEEEHPLMPLMTFESRPGGRDQGFLQSLEPHYKASEWRLRDIFDNDKYRGRVRLQYDYDFGDGWEHHLAFLGVEDPALRKSLMPTPVYNIPMCFAGAGHAAAEDGGGVPGWEAIKEAFAKSQSQDHTLHERREWYRTYCANGDPKGLDPHKWDIHKINLRLRKIKV